MASDCKIRKGSICHTRLTRMAFTIVSLSKEFAIVQRNGWLARVRVSRLVPGYPLRGA